MPRKEARLALFSAIAATGSKAVVGLRGHEVDKVLQFPLVVTDDLAQLARAKEVEEAFLRFGLTPDVDRVKASRKVRAGKGKRRGRKMKQAVGPLIVVAEDKGLVGAAANLPGVDVATVEGLNAELLAPGASIGRLTLWTTGAINRLSQLFAEEVAK
jgi:large subunit ribosomal protein L4e